MTSRDIKLMELLYPNLSNAEVAEVIGISSASVCSYARKYGWKKSDNFLETYKSSTGRKRKVRDNEFQSYNYWGMVDSFKEEQWQLHGKEHPFYESTQKQFKPKENTNGNTN